MQLFSLSKTETRLKAYSDPNVTHATSSDEQTIQYKSGNKKPPYWLISATPVPLRMDICSLKTKNTEKNEGKTESGKYDYIMVILVYGKINFDELTAHSINNYISDNILCFANLSNFVCPLCIVTDTF